MSASMCTVSLNIRKFVNSEVSNIPTYREEHLVINCLKEIELCLKQIAHTVSQMAITIVFVVSSLGGDFHRAKTRTRTRMKPRPEQGPE